MFSRRWMVLSLVLLTLLAGPAPAARAAWVWSPQTGWIGPAGMPKDTPEAQLAYALSFFEQADYDQAKIEFKKLLRHYRESREAADAQYYVGRCLEAERDYYKAFLEYRKTVQIYPSSARFNEVLERMAQIGNHFLSGKKRKVMGGAAILPARDKAVEIFQAIVEDGPFSPQGELAQYKLGLAHLALGEYEHAVTAFEQVIERYPNSPLVDDARFQIAQASLKGTFKPGYDQHATDRAIEELDSFVEEYPSSDLSPEAIDKLQVLRERRAQHEFGVAEYYERRRQLASALLYYQAVVEQYADTSWAPKAAERLAVLEPLAP